MITRWGDMNQLIKVFLFSIKLHIYRSISTGFEGENMTSICYYDTIPASDHSISLVYMPILSGPLTLKVSQWIIQGGNLALTDIA